MILTTTPAQRDIVKIALVNQKKLTNDAYSILKRLGKSAKPAIEASGTVEYLSDSFAKLNVGERDQKAWDINPGGAEQLRAALINWARQALARSESAQQLSLTTNVSAQESAAQHLIDQLNDQLSLPITDIGSLVEQQDARPIEKDEKVQPAPHRGVVTAGKTAHETKGLDQKPAARKPPRTIGEKTRRMLGKE